MRSVTVHLVGGLGNQLHGYAFGRAVAAQNQATLYLDVESGYWNDPYQREYLLDRFPGLCASRRPFRSKTKSARLLFKFGLRLRSVCSRLLPFPLRSVVVEDIPRRYQTEIHRARYIGNPYFMGYWASYRYYQDIEKELRQELQPPVPTHPSVLELLSQIRSVQSCFIHWRSYQEEKGVEHPSLRSYYRDAISIISTRYPNIVFFVFSDDPVAARNEIPSLDRKITYVDLPAARGDLQSLADFYLMYMCDHAIIGDSTFSWWAAWLSEREDKTIVAPRGLPWSSSDWLPPHWVALDINCGKE